MGSELRRCSACHSRYILNVEDPDVDGIVYNSSDDYERWQAYGITCNGTSCPVCDFPTDRSGASALVGSAHGYVTCKACGSARRANQGTCKSCEEGDQLWMCGIHVPSMPPASSVEVKVNERDGTELLRIPAGLFLSGPRARRVVTLGAFSIGKSPITRAQYQRFLADTGHRKPLNWQDISSHTEKLPVNRHETADRRRGVPSTRGA